MERGQQEEEWERLKRNGVIEVLPAWLSWRLESARIEDEGKENLNQPDKEFFLVKYINKGIPCPICEKFANTIRVAY